MTARVLVTGASGFVGAHAVAALRARGFADVNVVSRHGIAGLPADVGVHRANLLDHNEADAVMRAVRPTHLLHLAWDVTPGRYWQAGENLDWVAASLRLYRAFAAGGGSRVVVAGTCAEYDWSCDQLDEAATPTNPGTLYGVAKDALRRILIPAARKDGIGLAWARLFFLYGPGEPSGRLVSDVARALLAGEPALCGDGKAERDFMHVADVGAALAATLDSGHEGPINIASGTCVKVRKVVETMAALTGRADLVRFGARSNPIGDPPRLAATVELLREKVGFSPLFALREGLEDTLAWWRGQPGAIRGAR